MKSISLTQAQDSIALWNEYRSGYGNLQKLLISEGYFEFDRDMCNTLAEVNHYDKIHSYFGIYSEELILILVPLNAHGAEIKQDKYLITSIKKLSSRIQLTQKVEYIQYKTVELNHHMNIIKDNLTDEFPHMRNSEVQNYVALNDLISWQFDGEDWLYQNTVSKSSHIPRAFEIPIKDLILETNEKHDCKLCFPVLKRSSVVGLFMSLLFVEKDKDPTKENAYFSKAAPNTITNSRNFAQPCPPFCHLEKSFDLL